MTNSSISSLRKAAFLVPALCLASALTQSALGQVTFDLNGAGAWETGGNWVGGVAPTTTQQADFSQAEAQTAQLNGDITVSRITVSSTAKTFQGMTTQRTLTITSPSTGQTLSTTLTLDQVTLSKTGNSTFTLTAGTLNLANGGSYVHTAGQVSLSGAGSTSGFSGNGSVSLSRASGTVLNFGSTGVTFSNDAGVTTTFNSGAINFGQTGSIINNAGTINLTGTSSFLNNSVTWNNTGTLNVGATDPSLTANSTLNLTGGSFAVSITGDSTGGSLTVPGGAISLSGAPALSLTSVDVTDGSSFVILSGASVTGTFAGLANSGDTFLAGPQQYSITYGASDVTLTAVPEPEHYAGAIGLGLLAFTAWRRTRKTA